MEQRETIFESALATHDNLTDVPADVVDLKRKDLARAQPEARQQKQDREVAAAAGCGPSGTCGCDHLLDLLRGEERWDSGELPAAHPVHGSLATITLSGATGSKRGEIERQVHERLNPFVLRHEIVWR